MLTLAAGGTLTELMHDSTSLLLPVTGADIRAALQTPAHRAAACAAIAARRPPICEAIVAAVLAVQAYVMAHLGQIEEIEINPLICTPARAVAADVLIRIGDGHA